MPHLRCLYNFALFRQNHEEMIRSLRKVQQVLKKYDGIVFLIKKIEVCHPQLAELNLGDKYREMTWIDLVMYLL
jgi:hypothetical protein